MFLAVRMALYALFGFLAGQGLDFLNFDETTGQVDISFTLESLATFLVGAIGFAGTFLLSFMDRLRGPFQDESGGVSIKVLIGMIFGLMALAACNPQTTAAAIACAQDINARVISGDLVRGSPEYQNAIAICGAPIATAAILDQLIIDDDALGGGGKL